MLTTRDNDEGVVAVMDGARMVKPFDYDTRDRKSQKAAHAEARAFIDGAVYAAARLGLNAAGVPVFEGRAA